LPKLYVATLDQLLDTIGKRGSLTDQTLAVARQFSQFAYVQGRDKTGSQQSVPQQICQPFAILNISLSSGHRFDVAGIDEDQFRTSFKDIENRFPINASAFYSNMSTAFNREPIEQAQEVVRHGRESTDILLTILNQTTNSGLGVNVYATAAIVKNLHVQLLSARA
jgi:hypothetical protein